MKFFKANTQHVWFRKVSLYAPFEDWSPETVGRALRRLEADNKLVVGYYNGKYSGGLAKYRLPDRQEPFKSEIRVIIPEQWKV